MHLRTLIAFAVLWLATTIPAAAQNNRSAVSATGLDTNPCTIASPCRSLSAAKNVTNAGGEIIALDSAGYGTFTIDRSLTVGGAPGVYAAISVPTGTGITITAAATDQIVLRNLVLQGIGITAGGSYGVDVQSAGETHIFDCTFREFASAGLHATKGNVVVDHVTATDNWVALAIGSDSDAAVSIQGTVSNSFLQSNVFGLVVRSETHVAVSNSTLTANGTAAEAIETLGNPQVQILSAEIVFENSSITHNNTGVYTYGNPANNFGEVWLSNSVLAYNAIGTDIEGHSFITTFQNNEFVGNGSFTGSLNTATLQ